MNSLRTARLCWVVCFVLFTGTVLALTASFPERVATHFNLAGTADGWMSRRQHAIFILLLGAGTGLLFPVLGFITRFLPPSLVNIPNKAWWTAPENFPRALNIIQAHLTWWGGMFILWLACVTLQVWLANRHDPPSLDPRQALWMGGLMLVLMAVWIVRLLRAFRIPPTGVTAPPGA